MTLNLYMKKQKKKVKPRIIFKRSVIGDSPIRYCTISFD